MSDEIKPNIVSVKFGRVFVVDLIRWGDDDSHSYIWGVYTTYEKALHEAKYAMSLRAGKYDAKIYDCHLDDSSTEVYRIIRWGDFDPSEFDEKEDVSS